jgi:hypothetical protein
MRYLTWIPDRGETVDNACAYEAPSVERAAELAAEHDHAHRDGWEWTWPVTYHVQLAGDPDGFRVFGVETNREMAPTFWADKGKLP